MPVQSFLSSQLVKLEADAQQGWVLNQRRDGSQMLRAQRLAAEAGRMSQHAKSRYFVQVMCEEAC